jgi:DNA-binding PadR family transcriptional regulator
VAKPPAILLPPAAFLILFALAGGDKHGYAIMQEARELSEAGFQMGPATLYTTIQRLLESGWVKEVRGPRDADSRRRYYSITREGDTVLRDELARMESLVRKSRSLRLRESSS